MGKQSKLAAELNARKAEFEELEKLSQKYNSLKQGIDNFAKNIQETIFIENKKKHHNLENISFNMKILDKLNKNCGTKYSLAISNYNLDNLPLEY